MEVPKEPVVFFKATTAMTGPNDGLQIPQGSEKTDWEVELAVVIGRTARSVSEAEAMEHVAGYMLHNDYSERAWQLERGGQWVKGKSADTFAPFGPWLATRDEIPDFRRVARCGAARQRPYQRHVRRHLQCLRHASALHFPAHQPSAKCLKLLHANGYQGTLSTKCEGQSGPMLETSLNWLRKTLKELGIPEEF